MQIVRYPTEAMVTKKEFIAAKKRQWIIKKMAAKLETVSVPLRGAALCLDCEVIYMARACPRCGSRVSVQISDYLPPITSAVEHSKQELCDSGIVSVSSVREENSQE